MNGIKENAWTIIVLLLAVATSSASVFAVSPCSSMFMFHAGADKGETAESSYTGNCPMSVLANPAARQNPIPRYPSGQPAPYPCSSASQQMTQGMFGPNGSFSGVRRIYPKNVLDHPQRAAVYNAIVAKPGIDVGGIGKALYLNRETLRYHLRLLESSNKISMMKDHGIVRYYENHGRYSILQKHVLSYLWNPMAKQILLIVKSNHEITQVDIATRLGLSSSTVHWYMQRFVADGIVTINHTGKFTHYSIIVEALELLTKHVEIDKNIQVEVLAQ